MITGDDVVIFLNRNYTEIDHNINLDNIVALARSWNGLIQVKPGSPATLQNTL